VLIHAALLTGLPTSTLVNAFEEVSTMTATRCDFRRLDILADAVLVERPRWALRFDQKRVARLK
jgi:hypothetical protein